MLQKLNILEIRNDAIQILRTDTHPLTFVIVYYIIPILVATTLHFCKFDIETRLFRNLISAISLFAGMLFSVIFIVSKNFNTRKEQLISNNEEDIQYVNRYRIFSNNIISCISYVILKAIFIILLLLMSDSYRHYLNEEINLQLRIIWDVFVVNMIQFLIFVIVILKEIYSMQYDDINR